MALKNASIIAAENTKERNSNQLTIVSTIASIHGDIKNLQSDVSEIKERVNRIPVQLQREGAVR